MNKNDMKTFLRQIIENTRIPRSSEESSFHFWRGALWALFVTVLIVYSMSGSFFRTGLPTWIMALGATLVGVIAWVIIRPLIGLVIRWLHKIPMYAVIGLVASTIVLIYVREIRFGWPDSFFYPAVFIGIVLATFIGGTIGVLLKGRRSWAVLVLIISIACTAFVFFFLIQSGKDNYPLNVANPAIKTLADMGLENPGLVGNNSYEHFTYGAGTDIRRTEYGDSVKYNTKTVDAEKIIPEWKGKKAKWRKRYWGFGSDEFPINGRVWMPKEGNNLPLILIVHGNHGMEHHSDPGYAYLGELLASRSFITVSVDENFINGTWSGDFRGKEMPARAWLLLKHLEQWRSWTENPEHDLYQKADLSNVMLVGHSRGGEAISIAKAYNELQHFPDDASEKFDFNFGIKSLVAIAPTDQRYFRRVELSNVNYFSIQGSYDSDEASFFGWRQAQRISFSDSSYYFKSGLYLHGANHGQFNTIWGRYDAGAPYKWLLNTAPIIPAEDQRTIAKTYISAFAESTLLGRSEYNPLFRNTSMSGKWLSQHITLNTFADSKTSVWANFEEDLNVLSGTFSGSIVSAANLKVWKETKLLFRDEEPQNNKALVLGWHRSDSLPETPTYSIDFHKSLKVEPGSIVVDVAVGDMKWLGDKKSENSTEEDSTRSPNFHVKLYFADSSMASFELAKDKKLKPQINTQFLKLKSMHDDRYGSVWEPTLETFDLPVLQEHVGKKLKTIEFVFDLSEREVIILDNIGFRSST